MKLLPIPLARPPLRAAMIAVFIAGAAAGPAIGQTTVPAGWVEYASVHPGGLVYTAKLDSGARHTSIHASGIEHFRKNEADWVRFRLRADDGTVGNLERPLVRTSKTRDMTGPLIRRPVVRLAICVGNRLGAVEVNLSNRRGFNHGLLIGRSYLRTKYLINTGERHLHKLNCPDADEIAARVTSDTGKADGK